MGPSACLITFVGFERAHLVPEAFSCNYYISLSSKRSPPPPRVTINLLRTLCDLRQCHSVNKISIECFMGERLGDTIRYQLSNLPSKTQRPLARVIVYVRGRSYFQYDRQTGLCTPGTQQTGGGIRLPRVAHLVHTRYTRNRCISRFYK